MPNCPVRVASMRAPASRAPFTLTLGALGTALLLLQSTPVKAQTAADLQRIERVQQEEQQRQQRQLEQERVNPRAPTSLQPDPVKRPGPRPQGTCRDIRDIVLKGADSLLNQTKDSLVKPYIGRCLGVNDIERLMGDVTAHYVNAGQITARVYLGRQDLSSGHLELTVVEGVLDKLRIEDGGTHSISTSNVFPGMVGKPLNLRDVEQGLDQINRLSSNNATMSIEPGAQPGQSELVVRNVPSQPWHVNASVDNFGSKSTGRNELATSLSLDNPLGLNDYISLTDRRILDRHDGTRDSTSNSVTYSVPFGWSLLTVGGSYSTYLSTPITAGGLPIRSDGQSSVVYVRGDRVVYRNRDNLVTLSGTVTRKSSGNYLAGQHLDVSSRSLSVLDLDLSLRRPALGGILNLGLGLSQGKDWFGALKDADDLPGYAPRAQFQKERVSASWSRNFAVGARNTIDVSTQFNGQYSSDVLYGSEQMLIGGIYSVRGFDLDTLASDTGWMVRNEVGFKSPVMVRGKEGSWRAYAALDTGRVQGHMADINGERGDHGQLTGGALGVQLRWGPASLDTFVMKPLKRPSDMTQDRSSLRAVLSIAF